jgi:RNA polymerase sigma-54 factor
MILHFEFIENYQNEKNFFEALKIIKDFKLSPTLDIQKDEYVIPDIIILRNENNLEVKLNDDYYPIIEIKDSNLDKEYSKEKLKEAKNLIDALEMRKSTLYKIALMIVELQYDFFFGGSMKPMKLANIAEELDFAPSTISRAISNKYLMCDKGIMPLKQFFSTALDEDVSSNQIKDMIKNLIEKEEKEKPLNDEKLTEIIKDKFNIQIVRRTISKYREALNIPTSRQRKRAYKLMDK